MEHSKFNPHRFDTRTGEEKQGIISQHSAINQQPEYNKKICQI